METRPGLKQYLDKGYYNASIQLEYTSADFAIGQFALHAVEMNLPVGVISILPVHGRICIIRTQVGYNHVIRTDRGNLFGEDFRESTYKNYFWMVPYDIAGLVEIIGGKEKAEKRLDEFFTRLDAGYNDAWFAFR